MRPRAWWALAILPLACAASPAAAQARPVPGASVSSGVEPDTVTVGDVFRAAIRVDAPAGAVLTFPDRLEPTAAYQPVGQRRVTPREAAGESQVAVYSLVAWQAGTLPAPVVPVRVRLASGAEQVLRVTLPLAHVASVLPADLAGVEPRPAKGILPARPARPAWLWLIAAVALLVLLGAIASRRLRRRAADLDPLDLLSPRDRALAELERALTAGFIEKADWKPFFTLLGDALRGYLASLSPRWSGDLTTDEILAIVTRDGTPEPSTARLAGVLHLADLVKFARYRPAIEEAEAAWSAARDLVQELEPANPAEAAEPVGEGVA